MEQDVGVRLPNMVALQLMLYLKYTALQKFGNALEKWGFGRYHTSKHTSKLDPKHTSKLCKSYLERKQSAGIMSVMEWPPQLPDLNPIELLGTGP